MKKPSIPDRYFGKHGVSERFWRGGRLPWGEQYVNYPSVRAQTRWYHVFQIGRARTECGLVHKHENEDKFLLHYIRRGEMWHTLRNRTYRVRRGSVCLLDLHEPVTYGNDKAEAADNWWFTLGGRDMAETFADLEADQNPVFEKVSTQRLDNLFRELLGLIKQQPVAFEIKASAVILSILAELYVVRQPHSSLDLDLVKLPRRISLLSRPVRDSIRYMARVHHEPQLAGLKQINDVTGLSLHHFVKLFHREVGTSPIQYLNRYRVEKAKQILVTSNHSMAEVAQMVGIPDQFRFARLFRKITGATPSQFRARHAAS